MPIRFLGLDLLLESMAAVISLVIAIHSLKPYKIVKAKPLLYLYLGFLTLGAGMFFRVFATAYLIALQADAKPLVGQVSVIYELTRVVAYAFFILAYFPRAKEEKLPTASLFLLSFELEVIEIFLLVYVIAQTLSSYLAFKAKETKWVSVGFSLLLLSHLCFALTGYRPIFFLLGHVFQLLALVVLLVVVLRVSKVR